MFIAQSPLSIENLYWTLIYINIYDKYKSFKEKRDLAIKV